MASLPLMIWDLPATSKPATASQERQVLVSLLTKIFVDNEDEVLTPHDSKSPTLPTEPVLPLPLNSIKSREVSFDNATLANEDDGKPLRKSPRSHKKRFLEPRASIKLRPRMERFEALMEELSRLDDEELQQLVALRNKPASASNDQLQRYENDLKDLPPEYTPSMIHSSPAVKVIPTRQNERACSESLLNPEIAEPASASCTDSRGDPSQPEQPPKLFFSSLGPHSPSPPLSSPSIESAHSTDSLDTQSKNDEEEHGSLSDDEYQTRRHVNPRHAAARLVQLKELFGNGLDDLSALSDLVKRRRVTSPATTLLSLSGSSKRANAAIIGSMKHARPTDFAAISEGVPRSTSDVRVEPLCRSDAGLQPSRGSARERQTKQQNKAASTSEQRHALAMRLSQFLMRKPHEVAESTHSTGADRETEKGNTEADKRILELQALFSPPRMINTALRLLHEVDTSSVVSRLQPRYIKNVPSLDQWVDCLVLSYIVTPTDGYRVEIGTPMTEEQRSTVMSTLQIEDRLKDVPIYKEYFRDHDHVNFVGKCPVVGPLVVSIIDLGNGSNLCRVLVRAKAGTECLALPPAATVKEALKAFRVCCPLYANVKLVRVDDPALQDDLVKVEARLLDKNYKIGVYYAKQTQSNETEWLNNTDPSPEFEDFLRFLGDRIELCGFTGFRGGLDVKSNSTGTHSVYTKHRGSEIMFHVSTLLPYFPADHQQVERKRHIGNDIVSLIFQDCEPGKVPTKFTGEAIKSEFLHSFFIVQVHHELSTPEKTYYRLAVVDRIGVASHLPVLPDPPIFPADDTFRDFLLTKLMNAQQAALKAVAFAPKITQSRMLQLESVVAPYVK